MNLKYFIFVFIFITILNGLKFKRRNEVAWINLRVFEFIRWQDGFLKIVRPTSVNEWKHILANGVFETFHQPFGFWQGFVKIVWWGGFFMLWAQKRSLEKRKFSHFELIGCFCFGRGIGVTMILLSYFWVVSFRILIWRVIFRARQLFLLLLWFLLLLSWNYWFFPLVSFGSLLGFVSVL